MADHVRISKTLSYWLRHRPDEARLTLSTDGWTQTDAVLAALAAQGLPGDFETLLAVVEGNDKQRFEFSSDLAHVRARQGHSINVNLALEPQTPPPLLFHGTVERFLSAIMAEGLSKMQRHHVHLSADIATAQRVGARRGKAVVLRIDASAMHGAGATFFVTTNGVWLTAHVPPGYLRKL